MIQHDELANLRLVKGFFAIREVPDHDADAIRPFFTPDCAVRLKHTQPFTHGIDALIEQMHAVRPLGSERMRIKYLSVEAMGALVIAHRIDTLIFPDQPDSEAEMLGVFLIDGGKISEWTDYVMTPVA